ncbi:MAG: AtpZ/AtpI family protein [Bacteroidales bacterium]|nr:AtpZ/AtpI family protein [Bacteroidales bacterium]
MVKNQNKLNAYAKYSSIAIQMALIITAGAFGGFKLDQWLEISIPVFTLILSVFSVALAVYLAIRDIIKYNK